MGKKRYFCSYCNDNVSRGTRSNNLKELAEAKGTSYDTDDSESFEASALENNDSDGINNRGCSDGRMFLVIINYTVYNWQPVKPLPESAA